MKAPKLPRVGFRVCLNKHHVVEVTAFPAPVPSLLVFFSLANCRRP